MTDLENKRIGQLQKVFNGYSYLIITLYITDENALKSRILEPTRSSGYRDLDTALGINRGIHNREQFTNEIKLNTTDKSANQIIGDILNIIISSR